MQNFEFHVPRTIDEAVGLLADYKDDAKLMAGGTALTIFMKQSLVQPEHIISLHRLSGLDGVQQSNGTLRIGGLTSQRTMETSPVVKQHAPLLAEAYRRVATVRIRNIATVGGGLAHADPAMDPPPSLLILGASIKAASKRGERVVPLSDWFQDYYETALEPDEIVTEVEVPVQPPNSNWTYIKYLPRTEDDYATVAVAALGRVEGGKIADVRVALGAVGPTPVRATVVEEALRGQAPTPAALREASQAVATIVDPLDDIRGSSSYKRDMAVVFTRRALERVLGVGG